MPARKLAASVFWVIFFAAACTSPAKPVLYFTMAGSNTIGDTLAQALVTGYLADVLKVKEGNIKLDTFAGRPDFKQITATVNGQSLLIVIRDSGTSTGFAALKNHTGDIAMASRKIEPGEIKLFTGAYGAATPGPALNEHVIGLDGIAVIANAAKDTMQEPDLARLKNIFSGNAPAFWLMVRDSNSGTADGFKHMTGLKKFGKNATPFNNNKLLINSVADNANAIGFVSYSFTAGEPRVKVIPVRAGVGIPALLPNPTNIKDESYSLCRELNLYVYANSPLKPRIDSFLNYVEGPAGQEIVQKAGFVNLEIELDSPLNRVDDAPIYAALIKNCAKLSADIRFRSNSSVPDSRADADITRIVRYLNLADNKGKRVVLAGFSDNTGTKEANEKISLKRANAVKNLLLAEKIGTGPGNEISVYALGKERPVRDNTTEDERAKNRRVEVWIR